MNSFIQIIDLAGIKPVDTGKIGSDVPGLDFSQIFGEELSSGLIDLFGPESELTKKGNGPNDSMSQNLIGRSFISNWSIESAIGQTGKQAPGLLLTPDSMAGLIDLQFNESKNPGAETGLSLNDNGRSGDSGANGAADQFENAALLKTAIFINDNVKGPFQSISGGLPHQADGLKILNTDLNKITSGVVPSDNNNICTADGSIPGIDTNKDMAALYNGDSQAGDILNKVESQLRIKEIRLNRQGEVNSENDGIAKLELPTRTYIKVISASAQNAGHGNDNRADVFRSDKSALHANIALTENDKNIKTDEVRVLNLSGLEQKGSGKSETLQLASQSKLTPDLNPAAANNINKIDFPESKSEASPVRFVLPAEIDSKSIKNYHTVMIRMEPEHLGPIRMTVSSYSDAMTARLIVETPLAKAMVESNLSHLVDQLDRYGIKVDAFEVSVGNSEVGKQFSKNGFMKSSGHSERGLSHYDKSDSLINLMTLKTKENLYIGSTGVNCFA